MGGTVALRSPIPTLHDRKATYPQLVVAVIGLLGIVTSSQQNKIFQVTIILKVTIRHGILLAFSRCPSVR